METTDEMTKIKVEAIVQAPLKKVWGYWTEPQHVTQWNNASDDWHTPRAENDLRVGGNFLSRMEAKDGSVGFDFSGTYTVVEEHHRIEYRMEDGRTVKILFVPEGEGIRLTEIFDAESTHSVEMQRAGWQAILDNFKKYVEAFMVLEPLHFDIRIRANAEKVYRTMLDEKGYAAWTAVFDPKSRFQGSWEKGSRIHFVGEDQDGISQGMVGLIKENIPFQFVSIQHLGLVHNGTEITSGAEVAGWAGALENYTFLETDGTTLLTVDVDTNREYKAFFLQTWPEALQELKAICEA